MKISLPQRCACVLLTTIVTLTVPANARFLHIRGSVPIQRLFKSVGRYVKGHPQDGAGFYTLGRLHSLAYARSEKEVTVGYPKDLEQKLQFLPQFPVFSTVQQAPEDPNSLSAVALKHLVWSVQYYQQATTLSPKEALYWMGYGWMLEQGSHSANRIQASFRHPHTVVSKAEWLEQAVVAYRNAYLLALPTELQSKRRMSGVEADSIAYESGKSLLKLLPELPTDPAIRRERAQVQENLKKLEAMPQYISPILLPLRGQTRLTELLRPNLVVRFDFSGNQTPRRWPWVGPDTGLLVWDPEGAGKITSGTQLLGSVTWSIFWRDGYAALAALDDDGDGWLAGPELHGLEVWRDRNGNGRSEPGETRPVQQWGVLRLATRGEATPEGPWAPQGVEWEDGTISATWDWVPTSLPEPDSSLKRKTIR